MIEIDAFGNQIDPTVGYARGTLLRSSSDEVRRLRNAQRIAAEYADRWGTDAIGVFTGNSRRFPVEPGDLAGWCEEWVGPGVFADRLREAAVEHLGGGAEHIAAVTNRTSGGLVAAVLALSAGRPVLSVVPGGDRSHTSVIRGCQLAAVPLVEIDEARLLLTALSEHRPALVLVTAVTSTLARTDDSDTEAAINAARTAGATVLMDEAYGARVRPVLHGGAKSLALGADAAITNTDKAGLSGPRAGVIAGRTEVVVAILAKGSELGIEARAPVAAGALRSLEAFEPRLLEQEAANGQAVADAIAGHLGEAAIKRTDLGPSISEETLLGLVLEQPGGAACRLAPCEATAAVAMLLLRDHGVLTVNSHGQPGGRVCLRLKPTDGAIDRVGGVGALTAALVDSISMVGRNAADHDWVARLLFGDTQREPR